jgi:hypothetical protein
MGAFWINDREVQSAGLSVQKVRQCALIALLHHKLSLMNVNKQVVIGLCGHLAGALGNGG